MKYIDISGWQKNVNYEAASKDLAGVILRAGYGKGNDDVMFQTHYKGFSAYDVPIGVYWFSYATNIEEAANEAQYCISAIHGKKIELPVCFDFEDDSINYARNKGIKINKQLATKIAESFLSTIEANGYYAMLYSNPNFLKNYYGDLSRYDLWLANYVYNPDVTKPPRSCGIWQYGTGVHPGFSGEVDMDEAYKDYPAIIRKAGLNHLPPPTPEYLKWAISCGLLSNDDINTAATKSDVAKMLYDYHFTFGLGDDGKSLSGLLER